jgi:hypothetical protein
MAVSGDTSGGVDLLALSTRSCDVYEARLILEHPTPGSANGISDVW